MTGEVALPALLSLEAQLDVGQFGDWHGLVQAWRRSAPGQTLLRAVAQRAQAGATIYPPRAFKALELTPLASTRVVVLGQDPYHGPEQAEGLAFSVAPGVKPPPSLRNIFKELRADVGQPKPANGSLLAWAQRGALLLNTCLTVEDGLPASHAKLGWQALTDEIILAAAQDSAPKVFMLWGAHAQAKRALIEAPRSASRHLVLCCNHPSPLSALRGPSPFLGCRHFSLAAQFIVQARGEAFDWQLPF